MLQIIEPLVSILTPFHNEELFLSECIKSVLAQTHSHFEYILVDNSSTDRSLDIAEHYASRDKRIILHKNSALLSQVQNFNHSLSQISPDSKYCKIVQGDDWIFPQCLKEMVAVAETDPHIGVVSSYRLEDGDHITCKGLPEDKNVYRGHDICRATLLGGPYVFGSPTTVLYRSDIVRSRIPFYSEESLHEDTEACYEILENSDFGFVHQILSYTRRDNISISSMTRDFNPSLLDFFIVLKKYGPLYLKEQEYKERLKEIESRYYGYLSKNIFGRNGREFWDYHITGLNTINEKLNNFKLLRYSLSSFATRFK